MRKFDSNQLAATLANIGVIIGLVFLVLEIQQSNKIATATTEIEIRSLFSELNEALYAVPEVNELLVKAQNPDAKLTEQEKIRAHGFVLRLSNAWQAVEVAYMNDMLPTDTFSVIEDDVRTVLTAYPALAPFFRQMIEDYSGQGSRKTFEIVESALNEQRN
jgi:hypothetical protein